MNMIAQLIGALFGWGLILAIIVAIAVWTIYNGLVRLRNHVRESWSDIDTELKRRYDLIPNFVKTVQSYMYHEQSTLRSVIEARNRAAASTGSPEARSKQENALTESLRNLIAVSERYPNLKANTTFINLQGELANTEDRIQATRRVYNANVRDLNTKVESFPSNLVARKFRFEKAEFFQLEDARMRSVPEVNLPMGPVGGQPASSIVPQAALAGGEPGTAYCSGCGAKVRPGGKFCSSCGTPVETI
jgi:LemA protein